MESVKEWSWVALEKLIDESFTKESRHIMGWTDVYVYRPPSTQLAVG